MMHGNTKIKFVKKKKKEGIYSLHSGFRVHEEWTLNPFRAVPVVQGGSNVTGTFCV